MKLRIISKNDKYICQHRMFLIWWNFEEGYAESPVEKDTQQEAEQWVEDYTIKNKKMKIPPVIVKQYDL